MANLSTKNVSQQPIQKPYVLDLPAYSGSDFELEKGLQLGVITSDI